MQDEPQTSDYIIELIAKSLDESLSPAEQAQVNEAMQNSLAIRLVAEGLQEFDALLKRTGMAIPAEGFPFRVLARIEAYERSRTRAQWYLTLGVIFLGSLAALLWGALNWGNLFSASVELVASVLILAPLLLTLFFATVRIVGQGPLLLYALIVLLLTLLWVRVSGGFQSTTVHH
jgi:hypothetical protein